MPAVAFRPPEQASAGRCDHDFAAMRYAYRSSGGIARGDDLARFLTDRRCADCDSLAMMMQAGEVFAFQWQRAFWVPMFQFDLHDPAVRVSPPARQVVAELKHEFDGWDIAVWFSRPNQWLRGARPVDVLNTSFAQVLEAARTDRFIAAG